MLNHSRLRRASILFLLCPMFLLVQCKGGEQVADISITDFLPRDLGEGISRTGEIRTFIGESLWEYINGDAELYHQYEFIEVATADYSRNEFESVVDIYRFAGDVNAYGLYTAIRPDQPRNLETGVIGFATETVVTFVKGDFVIQLIAFVDSEESQKTLQEMAAAIVPMIPGSSAIPAPFARFPARGIIAATDRVYAGSFQGQSFLTEFYSQDYAVDGDTITLFMTHSAAHNKLNLWAEAVSQEIDTGIDLSGLTFVAERTVALQTFSGTLVAGVTDGYLAGMINYSDDKRAFLKEWLSGLTE